MSTVDVREFQKLDLRLGKVVNAEKVPTKSKICRLQIDIGDEVIQTIAGGGEYYEPEYFVGRTLVVLVNLQPKVIGGIVSKGMLLAGDAQGKPVWLTVEEEIPAGTKVR